MIRQKKIIGQDNYPMSTGW